MRLSPGHRGASWPLLTVHTKASSRHLAFWCLLSQLSFGKSAHPLVGFVSNITVEASGFSLASGLALSRGHRLLQHRRGSFMSARPLLQVTRTRVLGFDIVVGSCVVSSASGPAHTSSFAICFDRVFEGFEIRSASGLALLRFLASAFKESSRHPF